jgi:hypothetical protein
MDPTHNAMAICAYYVIPSARGIWRCAREQAVVTWDIRFHGALAYRRFALPANLPAALLLKNIGAVFHLDLPEPPRPMAK